MGVASRRLPLGFPLWDKSLGDALYTVMLYLLVAFVVPTLGPWKLGALALGGSVAIEIFQLTGIPARLPRVLQFALGTTFSWHDMACYVVGAVVAVAVHGFARRVSIGSKRAPAGKTP